MSNQPHPRRRSVIAGCLLSLVPLPALTLPPSGAEPADETVPPLLQDMSGTWDVKQWMWAGPGAKPTELPPAIAHRRVVGGKFLEESMTALAGAAEAFSRISYFDYNPVSGQYEYFSIDTRAPQMMNERSVEPAKPGAAIELYGGIFVATQWGPARNVPFHYRLTVGPISGNSQTVELYLTPMPPEGKPSGFLAFKYLYTRRPGP